MFNFTDICSGHSKYISFLEAKGYSKADINLNIMKNYVEAYYGDGLAYIFISSFSILSAILLFTIITNLIIKRFSRFKKQKNMEIKVVQNLMAYLSIIATIVMVFIVSLELLNDSYIRAEDAFIYLGAFTILLINLLSLMNIRGKGFIFLYMEKKKLEIEVSVLQKRKELEKLKEDLK